ncbi:hypothetical protein [Sphingomonas fuzhouensis]|uniref:hypothetical protein n=1 Tax=Sphingomonas fuzhouensis TaxID=3106033 RepID=UPI002AFEB529|nr:hypothetical protein [Sphingomonas sp. SGZ-02]
MILPLVGTVTTGALAGSGAGVVLGGAGIAWLCTRRRDRRVGSPEDVAAAAESALAGFTVAGAVVGADGQGALAVATDGRVAAIKRHGRRMVVCEIPWARVRSTAGGIVAEVEGRGGPVMLAGVDVLDIRRLAPR